MENLLSQAKKYVKDNKLDRAVATYTEALPVGGEKSFECLRGLGDCFHELEQFEEELQYREKHYKLAKKRSSDVEKQRALTGKGNALFQLAADAVDDKVKQDALASKALKSHRKSLALIAVLTGTSERERKEMTAACNFNIGNCCVLLTDSAEARDQAKEAFHAAIELWRELKISQLQHDALVAVGEIHLTEESWDDAIDVFQRAKSLAANADLDTVRKVDCLTKLSVANFRKRDYAGQKVAARAAAKLVKGDAATFERHVRSRVVLGLRTARKNLVLASELDNCVAALETGASESSRGAVDLAATAERAADICIELEQSARAIELYLQSVEFLGDDSDPAPLYASIALTYQDLGQLANAVDFFRKELHAHNTRGRHNDVVETHLRIARVFEEEGSSEALAAEVMAARKAVDMVLGTCDVGSDTSSVDVVKTLRLALEIEDVVQSSESIDDALRAQSTLRIDDHETALESALTNSHVDPSQADEGELSDGTDISFTDSNPEEYDLDAAGPRVIKKVGGNINRRNEQGETKLQQAVIRGDFTAVEKLLAANASVNCFDNYGWTPLHEACNHGHVEIVKELLRQPEIRVNDVGEAEVKKMQLTPLHDAAGNGHSDICQLLVQSCADVTLKTYEGKTPLEKAIEGGNADTAEYLRGVAESKGLTEVLEEVADLEVPDDVAYDSDDLVLQYVPLKATTNTIESSMGDTRGRQGARERQAAARARQLLGDSDPENSGNDSDFEPVIYQRESARLTLADIALTHTHGYQGGLGLPAKHAAPTVGDSVDAIAAPIVTESLSWDSPSPPDDNPGDMPPEDTNFPNFDTDDDAEDEALGDTAGVATTLLRDRNRTLVKKKLALRKKRKVDTKTDLVEPARDPDRSRGKSRSVGVESGGRNAGRKRGSSRAEKSRSKGLRIGEQDSEGLLSRQFSDPDDSAPSDNDYVVLSPSDTDEPRDGDHFGVDDAETTPIVPAAPIVNDLATFSVTAKIVDGRGSVAVPGIPDKAEVDTLQELILVAYRSKYGTAPIVRRLANESGETLRPFERVRVRIEPACIVQIIVESWPENDTFADRVTTLWAGRSKKDAHSTERLRCALEQVAQTAPFPTTVSLPRVGLIGTEPRLLATVLHHATWIVVLNLSDNHLGDSFARLLGEALSGMFDLSELHLAGNSFTHSGVPFLVSPHRLCNTARRPLPKLTVLDLSHNWLHGVAPTVFSSLFDHSPLLRVLRLDFCGIEGSDLSGLRRQKVLTEISLRGALFKSEGDVSVAKLALQLSFVSLDHSSFCADACAVPTSVKSPDGSSTLSLRGCNANVTIIPGILNATMAQNIKTLDLRECNLDADAVTLILDYVGAALRTLNLSGNSLGQESCRSMNAWLRSDNCHLHELQASACGMDIKAISVLLQAMVPDAVCPSPSLKILGVAAQAIEDDGCVPILGALLQDLTTLHELDLSGHPWSDVAPLSSAWLRAGPHRQVIKADRGVLILGSGSGASSMTIGPTESSPAGASAHAFPHPEDIHELTTGLNGVWSDDDGF